MKTPVATKLTALLALGLLAATAAGCGAEQASPHFAGKAYGQSADAAPVPAADGAPVDAPATTGAPQDAPATTTPPTTEAPPAEAPADPAPVVEGDAPDADGPTLSPDALVKNTELRSYFDPDSARGIKNDRGYKPLGLVGARVKANLTSAAGDGMILSQTFGDGVARSIARLGITNSAGDKNRTPGQPTASTLQTLFRINSDACPGVFLCIDKLVSAPKEGTALTSCFSSPFPYGALPNYKAGDFDAAYKTYGPFTVTAFAGADVDCAAPPGEPLATETLSVAVAKVDPATLPPKLATLDPKPAQLAVSFTVERQTGDLVAPYADETVTLPHVSTYVMNSDSADYLALIVKKRQSIDVAAQAGGGILGGIVGALAGLDGVEVDLHFELCKNLLKPAAPAYCAP